MRASSGSNLIVSFIGMHGLHLCYKADVWVLFAFIVGLVPSWLFDGVSTM